jgi:hypothetical protein
LFGFHKSVEDSPSGSAPHSLRALDERLWDQKETRTRVYQLSRAIYRELAPYILHERPTYQQETNHELVLRACERAVERMVTDRRYFARPARALFNDIRIYFSIASQLRVFMVIQRNMEIALAVLARLPQEVLDANGVPRQCEAMTRKGKPCQRQPLVGSEYCPSHQHLTERFEELDESERVELELAA